MLENSFIQIRYLEIYDFYHDLQKICLLHYNLDHDKIILWIMTSSLEYVFIATKSAGVLFPWKLQVFCIKSMWRTTSSVYSFHKFQEISLWCNLSHSINSRDAWVLRIFKTHVTFIWRDIRWYHSRHLRIMVYVFEALYHHLHRIFGAAVTLCRITFKWYLQHSYLKRKDISFPI